MGFLLKIFPFLLFFVLTLIYTKDIKQRNPETIFLSQEGSQAYEHFISETNEHKNLVVQRSITSSSDREEFFKELEKFKTLCEDECEIIAPDHENTPKKSAIKLSGENYLAFVYTGERTSSKDKELLKLLETHPFWKIGSNTFILGIPYTNFQLDKYSTSIRTTLFPILFVLAFVFIILITQSFRNSLLIFLPSLLSSTVGLSAIKYYFVDMNMITSIVPLLLFTINLALSFHIFFALKEYRCLKETLKHKFLAIFLMVLTTSIGFGSLGLSQIQVIRSFAFLTSFLILCTTVITLLWYQVVTPLLKYETHPRYQLYKIEDRVPKKSWSLKTIGLLTIITLLLALWNIPKIDIITDATRYFPKNSQIQDQMKKVATEVAGLPLYEILISLPERLTTTELNQIEQIEKRLEEIPLSQKYRVLSANKLVKTANLSYSGTNSLPSHILAYHALRSKLPTSLRESYPLENHYRLTLLGAPLNVDEYKKDLKTIKEQVFQKSDLQYSVNGLYYNLMFSQRAMINLLAKSFGVSLIIITLITFFFIRKLKIIAIFTFVNIIPVLLSLSVLRFLGLSINIATVMTYSISLGIIVDSSLHIVLFLEKKGRSFYEYHKTIFRPVLLSGLLFSASFLLFAFNDFLPIKQFGANLSVILFIGLIFDLYILPTLYRGGVPLDPETYDEK